ncbi:MAG: acyl-CoA/acyl-ACP dehydrogenase [Firmicutes bacterium]|nr:acyl-CoA/acyl-ACP dehydrogenase [Bacillota bacterium]
MEFLFTEEQLMLRDSVRKFCTNELTKEYVRWMDENVNFPPDDLWKKIVDLGLMGLAIPEEYGGAGLGIVDMVIASEEIATASSAVAIAIGAASFGTKPILEMGTEEQKNFFLPKIAAGECKFCMALTEPAGGTDILGAIKSTAVKKGDKFILNGQKVFITGAHVADYIMAIAITDPAAKRHKGLSIFIVDAKSPGITIRPIKKLGIHACGTTEIFFDNVEVPKENLLGQLNNGWIQLLMVLNPERIVTAVLSLGIAKAALQDAIEYSLQRQAFGVPIAKFQILQHYMADMAVEIENARNIIYKSAFLCEKGMPYHMEASIAKIVAGRASEIAAIKGMEILGGYGYAMEYDMQRYFRDYKQMIFSPISEEMAKNMIAQWIGLPKSY